jgi:ribosomal protein S18 acetylase RimI-like enzyme
MFFVGHMIDIRILTADDAPAFAQLRLRALQTHPEAFGEGAEEFAARPLAEIEQRIGDGNESFIFAAFNPELCGTVGLVRHKGAKDRHKAFIWGVYVDSPVRGQGIARRLMEAAIERARTLPGLEDLQLTVVTTNAPAIALYEDLGFTTYGIEPHALKIGAQYHDEAMMRLELHKER